MVAKDLHRRVRMASIALLSLLGLAGALQAPPTSNARRSALKATVEDRVVLVAGVLSLTGRSVARELGKADLRVKALVGSESYLQAADDDGRQLGADCSRYDCASAIDALVVATDEPPDAKAAAQLVADAVARGASTVVAYSRLGAAAGGAAAALEALGGDAAAWARYEAAVVSASGGASVKVLRTGAMLGGPYYALDVDTLRAQTARVVDDERAVAVLAPSAKRSQPGFGGSRVPLAGLASLALDAPSSFCADATTGPGQETGEAELRAGLAAAPAPERAAGAPPPASDFGADVLAAFAEPRQLKAVNPFLAPPAVSGPYWFVVFGAAFQLWLASFNWTWCDPRLWEPGGEETRSYRCDVGWVVAPASPAHGAFSSLDTLCEWDAKTKTARRVDALSVGYKQATLDRLQKTGYYDEAKGNARTELYERRTAELKTGTK